MVTFKNAIGVFCYLSKYVCHKTLIYKLRHYGVHGNALDLIMTCLDNRIQCVDTNGSKSKDSILGLFVFNLC